MRLLGTAWPESSDQVTFRNLDHTPSYDVRWSLFLHDDFRKYVPVSYEDQSRVFQAWREEIKKSAGFQWGPGHNADQAMEREQSADREQPADEE